MTQPIFGCAKCEGHDFTLSKEQIPVLLAALEEYASDLIRYKINSPLILEEIAKLQKKLNAMQRYHLSKKNLDEIPASARKDLRGD